MVNKAVAGDPRAFAQIVQIAEKLEAFKWPPPEVNHNSLVESAIEKLERGIARLATAPEEEASSTDKPQNAPTQKDPGNNKQR